MELQERMLADRNEMRGCNKFHEPVLKLVVEILIVKRSIGSFLTFL